MWVFTAMTLKCFGHLTNNVIKGRFHRGACLFLTKRAAARFGARTRTSPSLERKLQKPYDFLPPVSRFEPVLIKCYNNSKLLSNISLQASTVVQFGG